MIVQSACEIINLHVCNVAQMWRTASFEMLTSMEYLIITFQLCTGGPFGSDAFK